MLGDENTEMTLEREQWHLCINKIIKHQNSHNIHSVEKVRSYRSYVYLPYCA